MVLAAGRLDVDLTRETLTTEEDVGVTAVLDLGEAGLLVDVEGDILEVASKERKVVSDGRSRKRKNGDLLDLREGDPEGVLPKDEEDDKMVSE